MVSPATKTLLQSLILSANDLRQMTDWPEALIEDYLNIIYNFVLLANKLDIEIDQKIEEIPTSFLDGSIPFADSGFLIEDNDDLFWDNVSKFLSLPNTGLKLFDTNGSHGLFIKPGSNLTVDRILTLITGDAARTITLTGNPTLDDWFDQAVKVASSPTFAGLITTAGRIQETTLIDDTDSPYTALSTDHILFCDTDGGAITTNLPAGSEGTHYKLINCGSSGNDLTVDPNGTEQLYGSGAGVASVLADGEVIDIHYNATKGWW